MDRRMFLAAVGTAAVAGCSDLRGESESTEASSTPTETMSLAGGDSTQTPDQNERGDPSPPEIQFATPVYRWDEFGDADANAISAVGRGAGLPVAARFDVWAHGGTVDTTRQVRAYDGNSRVAIQSDTTETVAEGSGYREWEAWVNLDTTGWGYGQFDGDYLVRDNVLDETSQAAEWSVEVVEPLTGTDASLVSYNGPRTVRVGERFSYSLEMRNNTSRDSSVVSTLSVRTTGYDWTTATETRSFNIPARSTVVFDVEDVSLSTAGTFEYRIDTIGDTWSVTVEE